MSQVGSIAALLAAPGIDVNARAAAGGQVQGWTALMFAASAGHAAAITALLAAEGLEVNAKVAAGEMQGWTALMAAAAELDGAVVSRHARDIAPDKLKLLVRRRGKMVPSIWSKG